MKVGHSMRSKQFIIAAVLAVALIAGVTAWAISGDKPAPAPEPAPTTSDTTLEGEAVCLPHKDTSGPQTMECALGIKTGDGSYYGLRDEDPAYTNVASVPMGQKVRMSGTLTREPSDRYQSVGTLSVKRAELLP